MKFVILKNKPHSFLKIAAVFFYKDKMFTHEDLTQGSTSFLSENDMVFGSFIKVDFFYNF